MIEEMPPLCTRVLFCIPATDETVMVVVVTKMTHSINDYPACVRKVEVPSVRGQECTHWAPLPDENDSRWRPYPSNPGPGWEQSVLCFSRAWPDPFSRGLQDPNERIQYVSSPVGPPPAFPGFGGSPMTRDWGILKWMPLEEAIRDLRAIPQDVMNKMRPFDWEMKERAIAVDAAAENIFLTVINDGHCYKTWFEPLCRKKGAVTFNSIHRATRKSLVYLLNKNQIEKDSNVWHDAIREAMDKILNHYLEHSKEVQHV